MISAGHAGKIIILIEQAPMLGGVLSSGMLRLNDLYVADALVGPEFTALLEVEGVNVIVR